MRGSPWASPTLRCSSQGAAPRKLGHCPRAPLGPGEGPPADLGKGPCAHSGFPSGAETASPAQAPQKVAPRSVTLSSHDGWSPPCSDGAQAPAAEPRAGPGSQTGSPFSDSPQNCVSVRPSLACGSSSPGLRAPCPPSALAPQQRLLLAVLPVAALALLLGVRMPGRETELRGSLASAALRSEP